MYYIILYYIVLYISILRYYVHGIIIGLLRYDLYVTKNMESNLRLPRKCFSLQMTNLSNSEKIFTVNLGKFVTFSHSSNR